MEARREAARELVRGDGCVGESSGSAGPFNVKEIRRGRDDVAVAIPLGIAVLGLGFSGAAINTGVAGVADFDLLDGFTGEGAGAARGTLVVTVRVVSLKD